VPPVAHDLIDNDRDENCRIARDGDYRVLKTLLPPHQRSDRVSRDVRVPVKHRAEVGRPTHPRVKQTTKLNCIPVNQRRRSRSCGVNDILSIRRHRVSLGSPFCHGVDEIPARWLEALGERDRIEQVVEALATSVGE
jgi:hypothetical protein